MNTNLAYQEEIWDEMLNGRIVMMSPRPVVNHNRIASNIFRMFDNYLAGKNCTAIADGTDLYLTEKDRLVPDMMIVCDRNKIKYNACMARRICWWKCSRLAPTKTTAAIKKTSTPNAACMNIGWWSLPAALWSNIC